MDEDSGFFAPGEAEQCGGDSLDPPGVPSDIATGASIPPGITMSGLWDGDANTPLNDTPDAVTGTVANALFEPRVADGEAAPDAGSEPDAAEGSRAFEEASVFEALTGFEEASVAENLPGIEEPPGGKESAAPAALEAPGTRLLGVRLRKAGQVYFIADTEHTVRSGTKVVVGLEQGPSLGEVVSVIQDGKVTEDAEEGVFAPGEVLGLATAQDIAQHTENSILAAEASAFCKTCIRQRSLDMKLVDVEVLHDRSKIIFFFTAPSRIDFRELVKDLVRNYRTRIELRQIGVRHETQMIGGLGNCGMVCCCHRYLRKFAPVTIKMAKEQNLFLNPAKLSGMCGRLLCCLSFEQGNYEEFNRRCPKLGKKYVTGKGVLKVLRANLFSRSIVALSEAGEEIEMLLEEWDGLEPKRAETPAPDQQRSLAARGEGGRRNGPRHHDETRRGDGFVEESGQAEHGEDAAEQRARHHRPRKRRRE